MKNIFTKLIDIICFVIGPVVLVVNLISFENNMLAESLIYYPKSVRAGIGLGVALIAIGFLMKYWKKT